MPGELNIKVTTTGASQAASEIKKVGEATTKAAAATGHIKKPTEDAAEATRALIREKKVLKESLKELAHTMPGVRSLLLFLKNPLTIAAGAVGVLAAAWRDYLRSLDELEGKIGVQEAVARSMHAIKSASASAAEELKDFAKHLGTVAGKGDDAATNLNKVVEAMRKMEQMQAEKRSAQESLELAGVNEQEKRGQISTGDAIRARAGIKEKFAAQAEAARIKQLEDEQEARKEALRVTMEKTARAEAAHPGAVADAAAAERLVKAAPDVEKQDLETINDQRAAIDKRLKNLQGQRDYHAGPNLFNLFGLNETDAAGRGEDYSDPFVELIDEEMDSLRQQLDTLARQEAAVGRRRKTVEKQAKDKRSRADEMGKQIETGREASGKLFEEISEGDRNLRTFREHRGKVGAIEGRARRIESEADADKADRDDEEQRQREQERLNKQFQRRNFSLNDAPSASGATSRAALAAANAGAQASSHLDAAFDAITTAFRQIQERADRMERQIKHQVGHNV